MKKKHFTSGSAPAHHFFIFK